MPSPATPVRREPYTTRTLLEAFLQDKIPTQERTEFFEYSPVFLTEYLAMDVFLLSSESAIDFTEMSTYFSQIEAIDRTADEAGLVQMEDCSPMWLYHNRPDQAPDPGGNLVSTPFVFEIGYPIEPQSNFKDTVSADGGKFVVRQLRPLTVASVVYKGSYPHQDKSGFVRACQTLVPAIERAGRKCAHTLYREISHLTDWDDPTGSITEIQVELCPQNPD